MKRRLSWFILVGLLGCSQGIDPPAGSPIVLVPGGSFLMGHGSIDPCKAFNVVDDRIVMRVPFDDVAEQITHEVDVARFCMDQHEVTNEQYAHCVAHGACQVQTVMSVGQQDEPGFIETYGSDLRRYGRHPAVGMTWQDAQAYCQFRGGHLPTEAQWEYAARSQGTRSMVWADDPALMDQISGECQQSDFAGRIALGACVESVLPVATASLDVTANGVHDLGGNVSEYTADAYDPFAYCDQSRPALDEWGSELFVESTDGLWLRRAARSLLDVDHPLCGHEQVCAVDARGECTESVDEAVAFGGRCLEDFEGCLDGCGDGRMPQPFTSCGLSAGTRSADEGEGPDHCLRACAEVATRCMGCCTPADITIACAPTGSATSRCEPVPWCFPRTDHVGDVPSTAVTPTLSDPVIRGGHFMQQRSCDARPTRRRRGDGPRGYVGFRCVYDAEHPACLTTP